MSIHVALNHVTHYRYDRPVDARPAGGAAAPGAALRARASSATRCASSRPSTSSTGSRTRSRTTSRAWSSRSTTREFRVEVDLVAEMAVLNPFDFFLEPSAEKFPFTYEPRAAASSSRPTCSRLPATPLFEAYLDRHRRASEQPTIDFLVALNQRLQQDIGYLIRMEPGVQTPEETLANGERLVPRLAAGCWCSCCATSAWRRASSPAT